MTKRVKWSIAGVVLLGVAAVGTLTAARRGDKGVEVRIEAVEARDLISSVTASGQISPRTKVDLSADITGRIVSLRVKEGDQVQRGDLLLEIDPQQFQATLQSSEAALAQARAQEAQARANYLQSQRNYERLLKVQQSNANLVSVEELDQLKTQTEVNEALLQAARFTVEQRGAAVRDARWALSRTKILAPMTGRIVRLNVEEGETAIMGTLNKDAATLLTIADMSVFETKVKVDETDVSRIEIGDSAVVQLDAFPDTTFVGRVTEIASSSVRAVGSTQPGQETAIDYEVTIQLTNPPAETRPDFSATAKVVTDVRRQALSVPIIALTVREEEKLSADDSAMIAVRGGGQRQLGKRDVEGVFVVGADGKVTFRPVSVGIAGEKHFEILSGLKPGERIVAGTYQAIRELKDGSLVREPEQPKTDGQPATQTASKGA